MYYKRHEPFRYAFDQPIKGKIETFKKSSHMMISNGSWEAILIDLSPNGMKVQSSADIDPAEDLLIRTSFILNQATIEMNGEISWKKAFGKKFEYGILGNHSESVKELIVSELKIYAKRKLKNS